LKSPRIGEEYPLNQSLEDSVAAEIRAVWEKGHIAGGDADVWRKDDCGAWICSTDYGDRRSPYGWEIDHIDPNGGESISNKRPLQWDNNVAKGAGRTKCVVTSSDNKNVKVD